MHEHLFPQAEATTFPPAGPASWPSQPRDRAVADTEAFDHTAAIADVISVTGDTRRLTHVSTALLAAVLIGASAFGSALLIHGHPLALGALALLVPVLAAWLVTGALVLYSEGPVTSAFAELRRATGAPVNPHAPWAPAGLDPLADSDMGWDYVVPLIAAARRQHERARLALSVAVLTTAAFLLWMVLSLAVTALA